MSLPLVGTAVLYYTLQRIHSPPESNTTPPTSDSLTEPSSTLSTESPPRTLPQRTPSKRSFTPKLTKSRIVEPTSDLSSAQSDPLPNSHSTPSPSHASPASSSLLSPSARRRLPPSPIPSTSTLPTASTSTSTSSPRPRTASTTSRRSSISSIGAYSTRTSSTLSGFQPISMTSSKPLPPVLNSSGSLGSAGLSMDSSDFESYFDVKVPVERVDRKGKGKGKQVDTGSEIGLGLPPLASPTISRTASTTGIVEGGGGGEGTRSALAKSAPISKRSFSLPSLFKRKPSNNKVSPPPGPGHGANESSGDAKERLKNSIASSSGRKG
ncbi:hypothetical protein JCM5350_007719 [Sporobolomyces pararoseus]